MSRQQQQQTQQQETQQKTESEVQTEQPQQQEQQTDAHSPTQLQPPPSPPLIPPKQQPGAQDRDQGKKRKDCEDKLVQLRNELDKVRKDLEQARANGEPIGSIYVVMNRIMNELSSKEKECEQYKPVDKYPKLPDLSVSQNIIGTSVVRRKDDKALEKK